jgi:two-component system sensor histidine kinase/response regulator
MFETHPLPMWVYDLDTLRFLQVNETAVRHYGYSREEFLSMTIADIRPREDIPRLLQSVQPDRTGSYSAGMWRHCKKDGSLIDVEIVAHRMPFEGRRAEVVLAIDVTERTRADEARAFLASIVESSEDSIIGRTLEGTIISWNRGAERLYGYTAEEAIGKPITMLVPRERWGESMKRADRLKQNENIQSYETIGLRKDGTQINLSLILSPIKDTLGRLIGASAISRDITDRKRAEESLRRGKELAEAANRLKSEFLANMSHEIRTPMNGIMAMTDLVLDTQLTSEQSEYLETVKSSAEALLTIINDILDFSKIEAGRLDLDPSDFDLREVLGQAVKLLLPEANRKGLELIWDVSPSTPGLVRGDVTRLRQIILNLTGNAIKFSKRGEIVLRVEPASEDDAGTVLHFQVRDNGIGIPPDKQQIIFDAFSQADGSITRQFGGTGLGLTISSRLVKMMEGRIWVESDVGRGSTFHFTGRFGRVESLEPFPGAEAIGVNMAGFRANAL